MQRCLDWMAGSWHLAQTHSRNEAAHGQKDWLAGAIGNSRQLQTS